MANEILALDSSPLGRLVHSRQNGEVADWLDGVLARGATVYIPEIIDYELRHALLFGNLTRSLQRLDELEEVLPFVPLDRATMLDAAELWAQARRRGKSVADPKELDGDAILAAQVRRVGAVVVTENVGHLSVWVEARLAHVGVEVTNATKL